MALIRWRPFQEIEILNRQMDKIFDDFFSHSREMTTSWTPAVELKDTNENLTLRAELPGVEGKDLEVQVTRQAIYIAGETRYESTNSERGYFRSELRYGKFQRTISLPVPVKNEEVKAEFKNGILTLTLPKIEESRFKVVKLKFTDDNKVLTDSDSGTVVDLSVQKT
ncbi:MAG: Hsp20/alpha crystallin family protein [Brasilonema octagenarum HA4186-MV1]|jgi:HSP20 family protein|nr:Hsp20/alpha crystallin family protein [Brasilonema octagenarum HA4186-MV1]